MQIRIGEGIESPGPVFRLVSQNMVLRIVTKSPLVRIFEFVVAHDSFRIEADDSKITLPMLINLLSRYPKIGVRYWSYQRPRYGIKVVSPLQKRQRLSMAVGIRQVEPPRYTGDVI